ncbi:MAG: HDOD domain-containing protein [Spirochaetales bacterium]
MKGQELRQALVGYIDRMPALPTSIGKVLEICQRPNAQPADLNRVISLDPVLLARVMKLINSAYYGLNQEVTSLVRAIIMLGLNTVKNLALSTAVLGTVNTGGTKSAVLNLDGFWLHSLCVGVTAKHIARARGITSTDVENYFFCGLLHDIGKVPLNNRAPEDYLTALSASANQRIPLHQAEAQQLEFTHCEAGALIIRTWKLSDDILDVVSWHHDPQNYSGPHGDLVNTVVLADYFANILEIGFSGNRFPLVPPAEVYKSLGLSWGQIEALEPQVRQEIEKAKIFLKLA